MFAKHYILEWHTSFTHTPRTCVYTHTHTHISHMIPTVPLLWRQKHCQMCGWLWNYSIIKHLSKCVYCYAGFKYIFEICKHIHLKKGVYPCNYFIALTYVSAHHPSLFHLWFHPPAASISGLGIWPSSWLVGTVVMLSVWILPPELQKKQQKKTSDNPKMSTQTSVFVRLTCIFSKQNSFLHIAFWEIEKLMDFTIVSVVVLFRCNCACLHTCWSTKGTPIWKHTIVYWHAHTHSINLSFLLETESEWSIGNIYQMLSSSP